MIKLKCQRGSWRAKAQCRESCFLFSAPRFSLSSPLPPGKKSCNVFLYFQEFFFHPHFYQIFIHLFRVTFFHPFSLPIFLSSSCFKYRIFPSTLFTNILPTLTKSALNSAKIFSTSVQPKCQVSSVGRNFSSLAKFERTLELIRKHV